MGVGLVTSDVVGIVGGHQRDACTVTEFHQRPVDRFHLGDLVFLEFQEETVRTKEVPVPFGCRTSTIGPIGLQQTRYFTSTTGREGNKALVKLFENPGHGNRWLYLYLEGVQSNRDGLGARIRVQVTTASGGERSVYLTVRAGSSFGSSTLRREIGLGDATAIQVVEVFWPTSGERQLFEDLSLDRAYRVREGDPRAVEVALQRFDLSP